MKLGDVADSQVEQTKRDAARVPCSAFVPRELHAALAARAAAEDCSMSRIVRRALIAELERERRTDAA
jgi:post-segregation antitoxin (ccd killing protein)